MTANPAIGEVEEAADVVGLGGVLRNLQRKSGSLRGVEDGLRGAGKDDRVASQGTAQGHDVA